MKIERKTKYDIEPQEIILDQLARKKEEELGISERKLERPLSKRVLLVLWLSFLFLSGLLLVKTLQLQIFENENLEVRAEENKFIIQSIQADRGVIYDKDLEQLVFNRPTFDLICEREELPLEVANILGEDSPQNLSHQKLILLETKIDQLQDCLIQRNSMREYKDGEVFAHLLGYTGYGENNLIGRDGLERFYEDILVRQSGKLRLEKDALGNLISKEIISLPQPGQSLELFLDFALQEKVYKELKQGIKAVGSSKGAAVMLDVSNGGVLSLVSVPSFDNNLFNQNTEAETLEALFNDPQEPLFNRAIAGQYAPGSVIKPLIASAVLQEEIISPTKYIDDLGLIEVEHRYDPEITYQFRDWAVHGLTDIRKALAVSCNVYFYIMGGGYKDQQGLGPSKIKEYLGLFGWGEKTQIDLPGATTGLLPDEAWKREFKNEGWWDGDTYHLSIGQGDILVTPIQVAAAFVAIANGGTLYQPQIVQAEPKIVRENFIDSENLQIVREGMRQAVTYGSAANWLNALPVAAAAKTGTAQTPKAGYFHNWVTVFAPYDDPQIVLTVMVENVKGMQAAVLPIARNILSWYFNNQ